jgi:hypothetical protein
MTKQKSKSELSNFASILCLLVLTACHPFSNLARETEIKPEGMYVSVYNAEVRIKALTFGDFEFARNRKELRQIRGNAKGFNKMLFYAKTTQPAYEYCIMYEPVKLKGHSDEYTYSDTLIGEKKFVLGISKKAPADDLKFIRQHIYPYDAILKSEETGGNQKN